MLTVMGDMKTSYHTPWPVERALRGDRGAGKVKAIVGNWQLTWR